MKFMRVAVPLMALSMVMAGTALAQTPSSAAFGSRMRAALDVPLATTTVPALPPGTSERVQTPSTTTVPVNEPYNAGHDLTGGIVAAGGAILAAVVIVLLFGVIASSRHTEQE